MMDLSRTNSTLAYTDLLSSTKGGLDFWLRGLSSIRGLNVPNPQYVTSCLDYHAPSTFAATLISSIVLLLCLLPVLNWVASYHDDIPMVNRYFALEPRILSRFRWAFNCKAILDHAEQKYPGQPYRLARGDVDVLVLPATLLPELQKLKEMDLNSHKYQCQSINGHLNELDIGLQSNLHMKLMLSRGTPALPSLVKPLGERAQTSIREQFPLCETSWEEVQPLNRIAQCISQLMAVLLLGIPMCDNSKLVELSPRLTQIAFSIAFGMRFVPRFLERSLLWLFPSKWALGGLWRELDDIVVPELERRKSQNDYSGSGNVASWMMLGAKHERDADPKLISRLIGSAFAGGLWSTSSLILGVLADLAVHPHFLEEIREEIRLKHIEVRGQWDFAALTSLAKLDSAMKETTRLAPGSRLVFGRVVENDLCLSNGLTLRNGQHIATPLHTHYLDPSLVPDPGAYDPLRWYRRDPEAHRKAPFTTLDDIGRWGSGRRACPGRFLANIAAKIMLVKLLDDYDIERSDGQRLKVSFLHEFTFVHPDTKIRMRRRRERLDVTYG